ncbi:hypothetical protein H6A21_10435, partial [Collinsella tanakaei]
MYMTPQACADAGAAYPDYELFIGFDVGKSFHVAHARDRAGRRVGPGRVDNVEDAACALPSPAIGAAGANPSRTLVVDQRRNIGTTVDWQHLFGRFRQDQPRLPELDGAHVAERRVDPEVVV